jgi:hypothetical protein
MPLGRRLVPAGSRRLDQEPAPAPAVESEEAGGPIMIRKLASGEYRLYSRKVDPKTGKRRNLGTFRSRAAAEKHEREVQYFKRH